MKFLITLKNSCPTNVWTNSTMLHNETWIRQEVAQMRRHDSTFLWLLNFNDWQRFATVKTVHAAWMIKPAQKKKKKRETASMNNCLNWGVTCVVCCQSYSSWLVMKCHVHCLYRSGSSSKSLIELQLSQVHLCHQHLKCLGIPPIHLNT